MSEDRLDRIERLLAETAARQAETAARQAEMAARQVYHDEALERMDAAVKELAETGKDHSARLAAVIQAIEIDAENIRRLANVAQAHEKRLDALDGGQENG